jgi:hypothetical protein
MSTSTWRRTFKTLSDWVAFGPADESRKPVWYVVGARQGADAISVAIALRQGRKRQGTAVPILPAGYKLERGSPDDRVERVD